MNIDLKAGLWEDRTDLSEFFCFKTGWPCEKNRLLSAIFGCDNRSQKFAGKLVLCVNSGLESSLCKEKTELFYAVKEEYL
ncbi:hypothetical protein NIF40_09385 [[Clostridium] leptum]|nr:hypothetical protein [[Clostridium] leptum]